MSRRRVVAVSVVVVGLAMGVAVGCSDRSSDPSRIARPGLARSSGESGGRERGEVGGEEARRAFHAANRQDWVGVAHNRAMDEFRARLRRGDVPHDICNDLVAFMGDASRLPAGASGAGAVRQQRGRLAKQALQATSFCGGQVAMNGLGESLHLVQSGTVSPAAQALLDQIQGAAASASTPGELAMALNPILQASAGLPGGEAEVVGAAASVAQSSSEYWSANLLAAKADYDNAYTTCMMQYSSGDQAAQACLGLAPGLVPTLFHGRGAGSLQLTQGAQFNCPGFNFSEIVGDDVKGGISGAIGGFFFGGVGAGPGAVVGAGAASVGTFTWQWAKTTWCVLSGGGLVKPPRPATT